MKKLILALAVLMAFCTGSASAAVPPILCPNGPTVQPCGPHARGWATQGPQTIAPPRAIVAPTHEMFDTVTVATVPSNPWAVAGYTSGFWPTFGPLVQAFPSAHHLSIAINTGHDADCLDVEPLDATPGQAPGWVKRQIALGHKLVCLYTSISGIPQLKSLVAQAGVALNRVKWWCAWYRFRPGLVDGCDAVQFTDRALNRNLDESTVRDDFFGPTGPTPGQIKRWHDLETFKNSAFKIYKRSRCHEPQDKSPYCSTEGRIITGIQNELWSTGEKKRWPCFGPAAKPNLHTIICWIVRPEASWYSGARDASKRALARCLRRGPVGFPTPCKQRGLLAQRVKYFDAKATRLVREYS